MCKTKTRTKDVKAEVSHTFPVPGPKRVRLRSFLQKGPALGQLTQVVCHQFVPIVVSLRMHWFTHKARRSMHLPALERWFACIELQATENCPHASNASIPLSRDPHDSTCTLHVRVCAVALRSSARCTCELSTERTEPLSKFLACDV